MTHISDDQLIELTAAPDAPENAVAAEHVLHCDACRRRSDVLTKLEHALRDPLAWKLLAPLTSSDGQRARTFAAARRIIEDDRAAARLLGEGAPAASWTDAAARNRALWQPGVVRQLCAMAAATHERSPHDSLDLAEAALLCARAVVTAGSSGEQYLVALALRERSTALRYAGRFRDALHDLDEAERIYRIGGAADVFDLAITWYLRAVIFVKSERHLEATPLAGAAANVFLSFGDTTRYLGAKLLEGSCHQLAGEARDGLAAFLTVERSARKINDEMLRARALNNAGQAYEAIGDFERARSSYIDALALFDQLDLRTEEIRARWALAGLRTGTGDLHGAIADLGEAIRDLRAAGMNDDAALATLDLVAAKLAVREPAGVPALLDQVVLTFASENMQRNAQLALALIHEALREGTATPGLVTRVRRYLDRVPSEPTSAATLREEIFFDASHN
jgi:tetratricopeptide (TPR) repeat protein